MDFLRDELGVEEMLHAGQQQAHLLPAFASCMALTALFMYWIFRRQRPVYLLNYAVYKPPDSWKSTHKSFLDNSVSCKVFNEASMAFQTKTVANGGLGQETYLPEGIKVVPPVTTMAMARKEAEMVLFESVSEALRETNMHPRQVDIVIVNCSLFNPTPSLSAMIVNHFGMRPDIKSYNLSGMGCSAGIISIGLAKELLEASSAWRRSSAVALTASAPEHY